MNRERIQSLIDTLKTLKPDNFDHGSWVNVGDRDTLCGSTACIAGWCAISNNLAGPMFQNDVNDAPVCIGFEEDDDIARIVGNYLGLNLYEIAVLFYPFDISGECKTSYSNVPECDHDGVYLISVPHATLDDAIAMLERGLERGTFTLSMWLE